MSLIEKLKAGKKNVKTISWPGTDEKIGITVLTEAETQEAAFETERLFKKHGLEFSAGTSDAYHAEQNTQLLFRALVDPVKRTADGGPVRYFTDADHLRSLVTAAAKDALTDEYNAWEEECNPSLRAMTDEQYEKLFDEVKKNPSITSALSLRTLRGLITFSASRPAKSPTDSGSTSS